MCSSGIWSGWEQSSHTDVSAVPRIRLAIFIFIFWYLFSEGLRRRLPDVSRACLDPVSEGAFFLCPRQLKRPALWRFPEGGPPHGIPYNGRIGPCGAAPPAVGADVLFIVGVEGRMP